MLFNDLYKVMDMTSENDTTLQFKIKIDENHKVFEGHFPNNPITPGVVLLQILKNTLESHFGNSLSIVSTTNIKFLNPVNPTINDVLSYSVQIQKNKDELKVKNITSFSNGTAVLKCNITFANLQ